jgi:ectoine hydroxylase-related dioxygenase (phytanoyl-CoA dioxygenase family)
VSLTAEQVEKYREDGFLVVDGYLAPDRIERLRERFELLFDGEFTSVVDPDEYVWKKGRDHPQLTRQLGNVWKSDPYVAAEAFSTEVGEDVARLQGVDSVRLLQDMALVKPPNGKALAIHQDGPYNTFLDPLQFTTVWLTLDDTVADAGTLEYLRGSHHWGKFPAVQFHNPDRWEDEFHELVGDSREPEYVPIVAKAGTVVFHSPWIWHASKPSGRGDVTRRTYIRVLVPGETRHHPDIVNKAYSRYFGFGELDFDERFFPIVWSQDGHRSAWLDPYVDALKAQAPIDAFSREAITTAHLLDRTW